MTSFGQDRAVEVMLGSEPPALGHSVRAAETSGFVCHLCSRVGLLLEDVEAG